MENAVACRKSNCPVNSCQWLMREGVTGAFSTATILAWQGSPPCAWGVSSQLKIVTWANEEVASDALSIHGYERYTAADYALSAWYPPRRGAWPPDGAPPAGPAGRPAGVTKWWADGDEPLFYIVSSKV